MFTEPYILLLACLGVTILAVAWLPLLLRDLPLSLPMACVAFGFLMFSLPDIDEPLPFRYPEVTERLTELVVLIALMGAGLKLDRPIGWRRWRITWRLLAITMPLSILGIAVLGWGILGLSVAAAVLLGAVLAPTDPVLAADVQVGPPHSGEEDEIRFSLTSEAGLNDGLAFPFTNLAIAIAIHGALPGKWTAEWLVYDVLWKCGVGVGVGLLVGYVLGFLVFRLPTHSRLARTGDGFVALGITLLSYGLTEIVHGYGFLAVFVTALALRHQERQHAYHDKLHDFAEQTERLLMMVLLVLFGGALASGLLAPLTWNAAIAGLLFLILVRPLTGMIGLIGIRAPIEERLAISFFGIRGIGSFYYLAFAVNQAEFSDAQILWATIGFVVLISIFVHGISVTPAMTYCDHCRNRRQGARLRSGGKLDDNA
ncbi:cation:proton antiporter [Rhodospirillaceae bacterium SYSU D60014]|uniref:cation:proton antiporter n=1 Tax=Virgifigura deserti TaxID=2268457 RepID=UPI000E669B49